MSLVALIPFIKIAVRVVCAGYMMLVSSILRAALSSFILFIVDLAVIEIAHGQTRRGTQIIEGYPAEIWARLKARDQMLGQALAVTPGTEGPISVQYFLIAHVDGIPAAQ
jgi:hypothetical protein